MKQELKDLAKHRLERAENTLLDAQRWESRSLSGKTNKEHNIEI